MPEYSLDLHPRPKDSAGAKENMDNRLANWRRSIRRLGGFWLGTADYDLTQGGTKSDMLDLYLNALGRRFTESVGGYTTWEGFVAEMALTWKGMTYTRSLLTMANRLKVKYTRIGANLFTNGDVESVVAGTWTAVGTPTTHARTTDWSVRGDYSMHVVVDTEQWGTKIETVTVEAETAYQCFVTINVVAERWIVKVYDSSNNVIARNKTPKGETGVFTVITDIPDTNTDTSLYVNIEGKMPGGGATAEGYFDNAIFQLSPTASETTWYSDSTSASTYGQHDEILLEAQMTSAAATAKARTELARKAWPRSLPPNRVEPTQMPKPDALVITFAGFVFTLNWKYTLQAGQTDASTHITNVVGESDFVTAGAIKENTMQYLMPLSYPLLAWDAIEDIVRSGDSSYAKWSGGVYAGRLFEYQPASTTVEYHCSQGRVLAVNYAEVDPWMVRPGIVRLDDMPVGPGQITGDTEDDPRNVRFDEVEFIAPDRIVFSREVR